MVQNLGHPYCHTFTSAPSFHVDMGWIGLFEVVDL